MTTDDGGNRGAEGERAAQQGDWIEVAGAREGSPRRGEILEVLGAGHHTHFRVRWDEEHESLFYPGTDHFIVHHPRSLTSSDTEAE
jgi:hypothetical protein